MTNNEKKLIFLDIDGTFVDFEGNIPDSAFEAVKIAQKMGHEVFISTGRNRVCIYDFLEDCGFDGFVSSTGAYIEYKGNALQKEWFSPQQYKEIVDALEVETCGITMCSHDRCFIREYDLEVIARELGDLTGHKDDIVNSKFIKSLQPIIIDNDVYGYADKYGEIAALNYMGCKYTVDELNDKFGDDIRVTPASFPSASVYSGEITIAKYSKATAIDHLCDYLDVPLQNTIAIGDSDNDLAMLSHAGVGIAMGNAKKIVKENSDYITTDILDDGIYNALNHFLHF